MRVLSSLSCHARLLACGSFAFALALVACAGSTPPPGTWSGSCGCAPPPSNEPVKTVGQLRAPGSRPYEEGLTALRAVSLAGGTTQRAARGTVIVHRCANACTFVVPIEDNATGDTFVRPGDVIEVPAEGE